MVHLLEMPGEVVGELLVAVRTDHFLAINFALGAQLIAASVIH